MPDVKVTIEVNGKLVSQKNSRLQGTFRELELAMEEIYRDSCQVTLQATVNELARQRPLFALKQAAACAIAAMPSARSSDCLAR